MDKGLITLPTFFVTIITGVFVYVLGRIVERFVIEPIYEQKKIVAEIADALVYYANTFGVYVTKDPVADEAMNRLRSLATRLKANSSQIPWYGLFEWSGRVVSRNDLRVAHSNLIGLSNSVYKSEGFSFEHKDKRCEAIARALDIDV